MNISQRIFARAFLVIYLFSAVNCMGCYPGDYISSGPSTLPSIETVKKLATAIYNGNATQKLEAAAMITIFLYFQSSSGANNSPKNN